MPSIKHQLDPEFRNNLEQELNEKILSWGTQSTPNGVLAKVTMVGGKHYWAFSSPNDALERAKAKVALTFDPSHLLDLFDTKTLSEFIVLISVEVRNKCLEEMAGEQIKNKSEKELIDFSKKKPFMGKPLGSQYDIVKEDIEKYRGLISDTDSEESEKAYYLGLRECQNLLKQMLHQARGNLKLSMYNAIWKEMDEDVISYLLNHHPYLNTMEEILSSVRFHFDKDGLAIWLLKQTGLGPTLAIDSVEHKIKGEFNTPWSVYRVE